MIGTARMRARALLGAAFAAAALGAAGCGDSNDYENNPRPPAPINVTASISARGISVSPTSFGAGPIVLIITNQSDREQTLTVASERTTDRPGISRDTPSIQPTDTAQLKLDVEEGNYRVTVDDDAIGPATLTVGTERASAQNDLLQP